jgi:HSP20 family molecular chaperone IbpA
MWSDAQSLLERAERLQRQFFHRAASDPACWEPPIDVVETQTALVVYVALPGVPAAGIAVSLRPDGITVSGVRPLPARLAARVHRIEIPYGRFERTVALPMQALDPAGYELVDGCLLLTFNKGKVAR